MNTKLQKIIAACTDGFELIINGHRNINSTLKEYLTAVGFDHVPEYNKIMELNSVVQIKMYFTGVEGYSQIVSYDIDLAIEEAHDYLINAGTIKP